ncbi:GNAT family N-acetyltransferase [Nocardioides sp. SYSU D00038]|uniref:GNAT family N-acetyltransferase n=1 Tax=Nocardioides sp. SYSU D00038 TaxID=2812554 RepID=UPI00196781DF|nr:GNAT family N-acetyltransferase [Nocardioides sp. SYSU D00038]
MSVHPVDPADSGALRSWWEVGAAAAAELPVGDWPSWPAASTALAVPPVGRDVVLLALDEGGRTVGAARLELHHQENTHVGFVEVWVLPDARRRGHGRALLAEAERRCREAGRTTVVSSVETPTDADNAGVRFAAASGYEVAGVEFTKTVDLAGTAALLPEVTSFAAERLDGYGIVWWRDHTPEEHLAGLARLWSRFLSEAPLGELDLQPQQWTPERIREWEERRRRVRAAHLLVAGVAPDGTLAGYSAVSVLEADPRLGHITSTLVLPEHRGHRLGLAVKARLHAYVREEFPACEQLVTGNAGVNEWMNAVNDRLGYRITNRCLDLQKHLS